MSLPPKIIEYIKAEAYNLAAIIETEFDTWVADEDGLDDIGKVLAEKLKEELL